MICVICSGVYPIRVSFVVWSDVVVSGGPVFQGEWTPQALHPAEGVSVRGGVVAGGDPVQLFGAVRVGVNEPDVSFGVAGHVAGLWGVVGGGVIHPGLLRLSERWGRKPPTCCHLLYHSIGVGEPRHEGGPTRLGGASCMRHHSG